MPATVELVTDTGNLVARVGHAEARSSGVRHRHGARACSIGAILGELPGAVPGRTRPTSSPSRCCRRWRSSRCCCCGSASAPARRSRSRRCSPSSRSSSAPRPASGRSSRATATSRRPCRSSPTPAVAADRLPERPPVDPHRHGGRDRAGHHRRDRRRVPRRRPGSRHLRGDQPQPAQGRLALRRHRAAVADGPAAPRARWPACGGGSSPGTPSAAAGTAPPRRVARRAPRRRYAGVVATGDRWIVAGATVLLAALAASASAPSSCGSTRASPSGLSQRVAAALPVRDHPLGGQPGAVLRAVRRLARARGRSRDHAGALGRALRGRHRARSCTSLGRRLTTPRTGAIAAVLFAVNGLVAAVVATGPRLHDGRVPRDARDVPVRATRRRAVDRARVLLYAVVAVLPSRRTSSACW